MPHIVGTEGDGVLVGTAGDDLIEGLGGNDLITDTMEGSHHATL
jgi:Ca2+-binding RTX toxin-like protein